MMRSTKEPELKRLYDTEEEIKQPHRSGARARRPDAQRRHARGRRRDRALGADRLRAAVLRRPGGSVVTQFDKDDVEAAGLVKFDFLGLRTLTIIDWALRDHQSRPGRAWASRRWISTPSRWTMRRPLRC